MMQLTLPLIDLHRHLDGNVRVATILDLATQYKLPLPTGDLRTLESLVYITDKTADLLAFLKRLDYGVSVLANTDACERIAYENVEDAFNEGLAYVELRFSPGYMAQAHNLVLTQVIEAVIKGVNRAKKDYPVKVNLVGILSRSFGERACMEELDALLAFHEDIVALDLAGDERNFPAHRFAEHFTKARINTAWRFTIHAGEADGPSSIWDAIKILHADRIGHGVRAIEDPQLMNYLREHQIGIESCITSNYQTATWTDIASHPVKSFLKQGLQVCLNTDDPGVSNITLVDEYNKANNMLGINEAECHQLQKNAINMAFLSSADKTKLLQQKSWGKV